MDRDDTTISGLSETGAGPQKFLAARILAHPDPGRVGDFAPLFDRSASAEQGSATQSIVLSRVSPDFRTPVGARSGPLGSPRVSRNPLLLAQTPAGLCLRYDAASPPVEVNARALRGERRISPEELEAGLVILMGKDLVLWIGWLDLIEPAPAVPGLIGESSVMRKLRQQIHRVADLDVPVLLRGATGVGKELVASAIHKNSRRASSTYVAVNVAGVPPSMAASELFGHRRGAFTGAFEDRKGYFAQADGGTLFLDEIGDVSFDVQALLLRAVQEGVIQPLGGSTRQVDVRLIAATDSDLESAVARREFREPLLRRFSYEIHVPPLRARRDDIGILFYHLLRERLEGMGEGHRLAAGPGDAESYVPASFVADLALHEWSGNVRELANVALKFAIENRGLARARVGDELRELVRTRRPPTAVESPVTAVSTSSPQKRPEPSDDDILDALRTEEFRRERAARRLGVSKSYLYKRIDTKPLVPIAAQISKAEIDAALSLCQGDLNAAARQLRVSARALRLQLNRLAHVSRDA